MRISVLLAILAACAGLTGCGTITSKNQQDQPIAATASLVIPDVPVPSGFRIDLDHSYYSSSAGLRTGYTTYRGKGSLPGLIDFYKDNMPISGWALTTESGKSGSYTLSYEKGGEQVDVKITPGRFSTDIVVSFWPGGGAKR